MKEGRNTCSMDSLKAMGTLITKEADSMSAMKYPMNNADKALWMDMTEGRNRRRYREVVQSCILHSCESWRWNRDMVDTLHGWESKKSGCHELKKMGSNGQDKDLLIEVEKTSNAWFCNGLGITKRRLLDRKRIKETDRMMRNILKHANPVWREQRSTCTRILDPKNQDEMKRRRARVVVKDGGTSRKIGKVL